MNEISSSPQDFFAVFVLVSSPLSLFAHLYFHADILELRAYRRREPGRSVSLGPSCSPPAGDMGQGAVKEGSLEEGSYDDGISCFERSLRPCPVAFFIFVGTVVTFVNSFRSFNRGRNRITIFYSARIRVSQSSYWPSTIALIDFGRGTDVCPEGRQRR